mmetsp:Transcript_85287/g.124819  ORF Transcript_85287/g.124819 Transcript_85287/m.124819 type:complete len:228 (+) Transcript_85287:333-1016(+)
MHLVFESTNSQEDLYKAHAGNSVGAVVGCYASGEHGKMEELGDEQAHDAEHGNTTVLELSLPKPVHVIVVREAAGIETNVASQGAVETRGLLQEGDCLSGGDLHPRANALGDCVHQKCVTLRHLKSSVHRAWNGEAPPYQHRACVGAGYQSVLSTGHGTRYSSAPKMRHKLRQFYSVCRAWSNMQLRQSQQPTYHTTCTGRGQDGRRRKGRSRRHAGRSKNSAVHCE